MLFLRGLCCWRSAPLGISSKQEACTSALGSTRGEGSTASCQSGPVVDSCKTTFASEHMDNKPLTTRTDGVCLVDSSAVYPIEASSSGLPTSQAAPDHRNQLDGLFKTRQTTQQYGQQESNVDVCYHPVASLCSSEFDRLPAVYPGPTIAPRSVKVLLGLEHCSKICKDMLVLLPASDEDVRLAAWDKSPPLLDAAAFDALDTFEMAQTFQQESAQNLLLATAAMPEALRNRNSWSLEEFHLLKHLHAGHSSDVVMGMCGSSGYIVAMKVYNIPSMAPINRVQLLRELRLHSKLSHPNIIPMYAVFMEQGVLRSGDLLCGRYNQLVMVMELAMRGNLGGLMRRNGGRLNEKDTVQRVLQPLLSTLIYLHSKGIVHRDLKPGNVLFDCQGVAKLCDFGLALDLTEEIANTCAGTVQYMSPEVLRCPPKGSPDQGKDDPEGSRYGFGCDVWALGAMTYEVLVGMPLFGCQRSGSVQQVAHRILLSSPATLQLPRSMSPQAVDFIRLCLQPHEGDRPTAQELQSHPLIAKYPPMPSPPPISPHVVAKQHHQLAKHVQQERECLKLQEQMLRGAEAGLDVVAASGIRPEPGQARCLPAAMAVQQLLLPEDGLSGRKEHSRDEEAGGMFMPLHRRS